MPTSLMNRRSFLLTSSLVALSSIAAGRPSFALDDAALRDASAGKAFDVLAYGAVVGDVDLEQARANARAVEQAIVDASRAGAGSTVRLPGGLLLVHLAESDYVKSRQTYRQAAIRCGVGGVVIEGGGTAETTVRAFHDGRDGYGYSILQIGVPPLDNGNADISGLTLRAMTLDGNHFYAKPSNHQPDRPTAHSVIQVEGMQGCVFADLSILNAGGYGVGLQNGGYIDNRFERIAIRNTMADGIDVKDNGHVSFGNVMSSISVERFGLATQPNNPFAGVDLMGRAWRVDRIKVRDWGSEGTPAAGLRFKQGGEDGGRGYGATGAQAREIDIVGRAPSGDPATKRRIIGVHVKCEDVSLDGVSIDGVDIGVVVSQPNCRLSNFTIRSSSKGVVQRDRESRSQQLDGADDLKLTRGTIRILDASGVGVDLSRPGAIMDRIDFDVAGGRNWIARRGVEVKTVGVTSARPPR